MHYKINEKFNWNAAFKTAVGMSFLSMVEDRKERRLSELLSWVPDFSCRKLGGSLTYTSDYDIYDFQELFEFPDGFDDRG